MMTKTVLNYKEEMEWTAPLIFVYYETRSDDR